MKFLSHEFVCIDSFHASKNSYSRHSIPLEQKLSGKEMNCSMCIFCLDFSDMGSGFCATPNFSATALNHHSHHQIAAAAAHAAHHPSSLHHNGASGGGHGPMGMGNLGGAATNQAVALTAAVLDTTCFLGPGWTPVGMNEVFLSLFFKLRVLAIIHSPSPLGKP
jgi:hypothetical protein